MILTNLMDFCYVIIDTSEKVIVIGEPEFQLSIIRNNRCNVISAGGCNSSWPFVYEDGRRLPLQSTNGTSNCLSRFIMDKTLVRADPWLYFGLTIAILAIVLYFKYRKTTVVNQNNFKSSILL